MAWSTERLISPSPAKSRVILSPDAKTLLPSGELIFPSFITLEPSKAMYPFVLEVRVPLLVMEPASPSKLNDLLVKFIRYNDFEKANLNNANLSNVDLTSAFFPQADLTNADLSNAILSKTNLDNAILNNVILNGAILNCVNHPICIQE